MSKNYCPGFCHTCGTGCAQYLEQLAQAQARIEKLALVADAAVQLYNALAAQSGAHFEHMKAEWPELRHLKASFDNLKKET